MPDPGENLLRGPCLALVLALVLASVCVASVSPRAAPREAATQAGCAAGQLCTPITHIVFILKENRSFDNLFGTFPGAAGATTYVDAKGRHHPLTHQPDRPPADLSHSLEAE